MKDTIAIMTKMKKGGAFKVDTHCVHSRFFFLKKKKMELFIPT